MTNVKELAHATTGRVTVHEVTDYVYGGFQGDLPCPPHADLNPRKAFIICWRDFPFRFVFSHEASYCPWFELPSGGAVSFQFFEGNLGWAELFNNFGRQEQNSSIEILKAGPERVKVRWTYYGVNDDFIGLVRDPSWVAVPADRDCYQQADGVLHVTATDTNPSHLLYQGTVHAKIWRADGTEPEPAEWQIEWARDGRSGLAGVRAPHDGSQAEFEVDYILIKAEGLPLITVTAGASQSLPQ